MSADEGFLARWARRKRAAAAEAEGQPKPKQPGGDAASRPPDETQPLFDPASLPPIEAIGPGSDIRPFLAAGVPADLARAALRRAWSADPTIRDFIGLSENSWDFDMPGGVPGFGSLTAEDARRLLARVTGDAEALDPAGSVAERSLHDRAPLPASKFRQRAPDSGPEQMKLVRDTDAVHRNPTPRAETRNISMQHERGESESRPPLPRRHHGGALPD